jgi:cytidine deaminase
VAAYPYGSESIIGVWRPESPNLDELLKFASFAWELGQHYGGFKVGAVGLFQGRVSFSDPEAREAFVFLGANTKQTPDSPKDCAEMKIMRIAEGSEAIVEEFVVLGKPRPEDTAPTLHPCEACRKLMRSHVHEGRVVRPTTRITCVNVEDGTIERFTLETLHAAHGESLSSDD